MADDVEVKFGANIAALTEAINRVQGQLGTLQGHVATLGSWFGQLNNITTLVAGTLGTLGLDNFARGMAQSAIEAQKLQLALGVTGKDLGTLKAAAAFSGVEFDRFALTMERLHLRIQQTTKDAFGPQAQALKNLGLNARELIDLPADKFFLKVAEAASKFNASQKLTDLLIEVGGRQMAQMAASFVGAGKDLEAFTERMQAAKIGIEGYKEAGVKLNHEFEILDTHTSSLSKQIFTQLAPTIEIIVHRMQEFTKSVQESIRDGGLFSYVVYGMEVALKAIVSAFIVFGDVVERVTKNIMLLYQQLRGFFTDTTAQVNELKDGLGKLAESTKKALGEVWTDAAKKREEFSAKSDAANKKDAQGINFLAQEAHNALLARIDGEIKLVELGLEKKKALYERDVEDLKLVESAKIKLTIAASNERYDAELSLLKQKLALLQPSELTARQQLEDQIKQMTQQRIIDQIKMETQYVQAVKSEWGFLESALTSSFNTQLKGLLAGTTSWKNAMKAIFADLITAAIQEFLRLAIIKPLMQALSSAFSPAEFIGDILKVISKLIGQVFSGATAFFAPTLGPAAPAAGAAVAAATEVAAASYDTGAWSVPQTANALVHRDEMILPVDFASAVRSALTGGTFGGASNLTVSIQAWDASSVARWLRTGGSDMLARAVSAQYNQNPTIRPRY